MISTVRPNLRAFAYVEDEVEDSIYSTGFAILRTKDKMTLLPRYLYYMFMNYKFTMMQIKAMMPKGMYPSINANNIKSIRIPLPPIDIQKKIAAECKKVDEKQKEIAELIKIAKDHISAIISSITSSNGIEKSLESLCVDMYAGGDKPRIFSKTLTEKCFIPVYSNGVENNGLYGYTNEPKEKRRTITVSARGTLGYTVLHEAPFVPIVRLIVLVPNQDIVLPEYLKAALDNHGFVNTGGVTPQLTVPNLKGYRLFIPDKETQQKIVSRICEQEEKILHLKNEMSEISNTKQSILDKYLK